MNKNISKWLLLSSIFLVIVFVYFLSKNLQSKNTDLNNNVNQSASSTLATDSPATLPSDSTGTATPTPDLIDGNGNVYIMPKGIEMMTAEEKEKFQLNNSDVQVISRDASGTINVYRVIEKESDIIINQ